MATPAKPCIRYTHSKALRNRMVKLLDAVDTDDDPLVHREQLAELIVDLNEGGLKFFFLDPLAKLKMGGVIDTTATLGIRASHRVMAPAIRSIVTRMNKTQIRKVSRIMRDMMG